MESYLAEIAARTAGSVMLSCGKSASSKNISSRPPGTMRARNRGELAVEHEEGLLHSAVKVRHCPGAVAAGELGQREGPAGRGLTGGEDPHLDDAEIDGPPFAGSHRVCVP